MKFLQNFIENSIDVNVDEYSTDIEKLGDKKLFDYQKSAVENTIKYLIEYSKNLDVLKNNLQEYFNGEKEFKIDKINQLSYWMATGSGKTFIIVKLIEILNLFYKNNLLKKQDILFLTEREDLINQFKDTVDLYNKNSPFKIICKSLKEHKCYSVRNDMSIDFDNNNIVYVYYHKSGNIRDEKQVSKDGAGEILSFQKLRDYGDYNIILDEAHKGSNSGNDGDSKRFSIFSSLTENGFLFNFSATLVNETQQMMSILKLNLTDYIYKGYGKQISIMSKAIGEFRGNDNSKQLQIQQQLEILKSFILLAYIKKCKEHITNLKYHNPMVVILVESVNTENADLKKVFNVIFKSLTNETFENAKIQLKQELNNIQLTIETNNFNIDTNLFNSIKIEDIYKYVFNKETNSSEFEYKLLKNNELSFKYKNTDRDFCLINIGDADTFNKFIEDTYNIQKSISYSDESIFDKIDDSTVNILIGSRKFYEGWDSLRPNIILYINIGQNAEKFLMQSMGRGIRISPDGKSRKRSNESIYSRALERLFIFATYPKNMQQIIEANKNENTNKKVKLEGIEKITVNQTLLKPSYEKIGEYYKNYDKLKQYKLNINKNNLKNEFKKDLSILLIENIDNSNFDSEPIKKLLFIKNKYSDFVNDKIDNSSDTFNKALNFISSNNFEVISKFDFVNETVITSYKHIEISENLKDIFEKCIKVLKIGDFKQLRELERQKTIDVEMDDFINHYYCPVLYSKEYNEDITNIIYNESEYNFLNKIKQLEINKIENLMFSRIKEKQDEIYFPYIENCSYKKFYPDFVFWLNLENEYRIIFIDPKGLSHTSYLSKIDGFIKFFKNFIEEKQIKTELDKDIRVILKMYNETTDNIPAQYSNYIINGDNLKNLFSDDYLDDSCDAIIKKKI